MDRGVLHPLRKPRNQMAERAAVIVDIERFRRLGARRLCRNDAVTGVIIEGESSEDETSEGETSVTAGVILFSRGRDWAHAKVLTSSVPNSTNCLCNGFMSFSSENGTPARASNLSNSCRYLADYRRRTSRLPSPLTHAADRQLLSRNPKKTKALCRREI